MYKMFLDESGDNNLEAIDQNYPVLSLSGLIFEEKHYKECIDKVNEIKLKYFKSTDVILHSYDIRKQKGPFVVLRDKRKRQDFYEDLNNLFSELSFDIIATVIKKAELKEMYSKPIDPYHLSLRFIMERYTIYLNNKNSDGIMIFESRDKHSNALLRQAFIDLSKNGTNLSKNGTKGITANEIQNRIRGLDFANKINNEAGLQLADLVAYPVATYLLPNRDKRVFEILRPKFVSSDKGEIDGFGFKVFP